MFVKSCCLSYHSLPASLDESGHSLRTFEPDYFKPGPVINTVFSPTEQPLTGSLVWNTDMCKLKVTALGSKLTLCPALFFPSELLSLSNLFKQWWVVLIVVLWLALWFHSFPVRSWVFFACSPHPHVGFLRVLWFPPTLEKQAGNTMTCRRE